MKGLHGRAVNLLRPSTPGENVGGCGRRRQSFVHVLRPCLFTSLTTAAGMLSLLVANLQAIREFGVSSLWPGLVPAPAAAPAHRTLPPTVA